MPEPQDVELGQMEYKENYESVDTEREALLPSPATAEGQHDEPPLKSKSTAGFCAPTNPRFGFRHLAFAFVGGSLACLFAQYAVCGTDCFSRRSAGSSSNSPHAMAPPYVGSTEVHNFPPASPTNAFPELFPTNIGYTGSTPTGAEPALVVTAPSYPVHTGAAQLVKPPSIHNGEKKKGGYDLFKLWGNLSPWYSIEKGGFGVDSTPETPDTCRITGLHFLHRHGARYPTAYG